MSTEEQGKLNQELDYARQAVAAIQEVAKEKDQVLQQAMTFKTQLQDQISQIISTSRAQIEMVQAPLTQLRQVITQTNMAPNMDAFPAVSSAAKAVDSLVRTLSSLQADLDHLDALRAYALSPQVAVPGPVQDLKDLLSELQQLQPQVLAASVEVENATEKVSAEQRIALVNEANALKQSLQADSSGALGKIQAALPLTIQLATSWQTVISGTADKKAASDALAGVQVPIIPHGLDDLPPATIDLSRSGVKVGDYVSVKVKADIAQRSEEKNYRFRVGSMGLHREYTGQLVFSAPASGPNREQFQANAGVLATWKYGYRDPKGGQRFLDWLNPGLGIHAISLHQGTSTLEVGSGLAFSLWDDLLTGGYGWDLGVTSNRSYYFVGIGLLDLLQKLNKTNLGK